MKENIFFHCPVICSVGITRMSVFNFKNEFRYSHSFPSPRFPPPKKKIKFVSDELSNSQQINVQDDRSKHWRVQAVAIAPDRFESRRPLPANWRGLRDDELSRESGIPGCVFVHMSGFIGGNQTYEGALTMARTALKL